jgi:hypothetical protein
MQGGSMPLNRFGQQSESYVYRRLECGHAWRTDRAEPEECPFCEDAADAFAQDAMDDVFTPGMDVDAFGDLV